MKIIAWGYEQSLPLASVLEEGTGGGAERRLLSSLSFTEAFGWSSGMGILLRWTLRLFGGVYFALAGFSSSKLIRRGPFALTVSYTTYWCSSSSS